jgi:hypothetical protein
MPADAVPLAVGQPRRSGSAVHTITAWAALLWMLMLLLALATVFVARVTVCRVIVKFNAVENIICNFRLSGWFPLAIGLLLAVVLMNLLAVYEVRQDALSSAEVWKRPHRTPVRAYQALMRRDTPHRRKSMWSLVVLIVLPIIFYVIVAQVHISFE